MHYLGFIQVPWGPASILLLVLLLFWFILYSRGALKALFILSIVLVVLNIPVILSIPIFVRTLFVIGSTTFLEFPLFLDFRGPDLLSFFCLYRKIIDEMANKCNRRWGNRCGE